MSFEGKCLDENLAFVLMFSDGSIISRGARLFGSCGVFAQAGSLLNIGKTLEGCRSSFVAELEGVRLALQQCLDQINTSYSCIQTVMI